MSQVKFIYQAYPGEIFAPHAFDAAIGKPTSLTLDLPGCEIRAVLVEVNVTDNGRSAELTYELDQRVWRDE